MSAFDERLQRAVNVAAGEPALAVALAIDVAGKRVATLATGFQDIGRERKFEPGLLIQIGSQTKMLVAAAIHRLVRDGKLTLDDDIGSILPEATALTGGRSVSVGQLLNHSSGLGNFTDPLFAHGALFAGRPFPSFEDSDLLTLAAATGPQFTPGARVVYCNTGYLLLGSVIARVTGESFQAAMKRLVLEPIGMTDTYFGRYGVWPRERSATGGIIPRIDPAENAPFADDPPNLSWASSAGDGISSLAEMLRFLNAMMGRETTLRIGLEDFATSPLVVSDPWPARDFVPRFGYGMAEHVLCGRSWWGHGGQTATHRTTSVCSPELDAAISVVITQVVDARAPAKSEPIDHHLRMLLHLAASEAERVVAGG